MKKIHFLYYIYNNILLSHVIDFFSSIVFLLGLYAISIARYDIFYFLAELFIVVVASAIFIVAWNLRDFLSNHFLLFLSIAYASVSFIDIINTITYGGIGAINLFNSNPNIAAQLWIAARFLQALSLLIAPFFLNRKINRLVIEYFCLIIILIFISILYIDIFPVAYIDGIGATFFKKTSEYITIIILLCSAFFIYKKRKYLEPGVFYLILISIFLNITSEASFMIYFGFFDFSNRLSYFFRIASFLLFYKIFLEIGLRNPLSYIFKNVEKNSRILKSSELKLSSLVELATDAVVLTNGRGEIDIWNSSAKKIFGWKSSEVVGRPLDFILSGGGVKDYRFDIKQLIKKKESSDVVIERFGKRKNEEVFPMEISFSSWIENNEIFTCYIIRDVSERKKIEEELIDKQKKLEGLVNDLKIVQLSMDNAFTHIVITDENGYILYANKSSEELTGYTKEELIGNRPSVWGGQMSSSFYENFWKIIKYEKRNFTGEIINRKKNGELYEAEIRVSPVLDDEGEAKFFVAIERDLTEQKEIDNAKSEFISLAAHQLRTPLATISIASDMLLRGIVGNTTKEGRKYLKNISNEIKDMTEMVRIFLDVSRVEMNKFPTEKENISLYDIVEKIVQEVMPQVKYKKINFKKSYKKSLPVLNLDKKIIGIILENLLSNAIKYSVKNGKITLSVEEKNNDFIMKVSDNGIGIPMKDQKKIFTKMFRAENASHIKSESSGLGLYLAKNLAEQNGYSLYFKSKENKGSTFIFSMPKNAVKIN